MNMMRAMRMIAFVVGAVVPLSGWGETSEFRNWPTVTMVPNVGVPNPRDVAVEVDLVFPNIERVDDWGQAKLVGDREIEIVIERPARDAVLPALEYVRHTYVLNMDPNTAYIMIYDPQVTRQHLDLEDGEYTVAFKINERVLAKTTFQLGETNSGEPGDVAARFDYFYIYGSGVPIAGITGTLTFTLPPGYSLDEETLGNDDLTITGIVGEMVETLSADYFDFSVMESYPEQIRISYSIQVPDLSHDGPRPPFYRVEVNPDAITFNNGQYAVKSGFVGNLVIKWPGDGHLDVRVNAEAANITEPQEEAHSIVVSYSVEQPMVSPIDTTTIGDDDVLVYGFRDRALHYARFVEFYPTFAPGMVLARYEIDGGSGKGWTAADNGAYSVVLAENGVSDTNGVPLRSRSIGQFAVKIQGNTEPPPTGGPIVVAEARNLFATPLEPVRAIIPYTFRVIAIDEKGVNLSSVEGMEVTASYVGREKPTDNALPPEREPITAIVREVSALDNGATIVQADCELIAPDGTWDFNDNGHYVLRLTGGQVANALGQTSNGGVIGRFAVMIYGPIADAQETNSGWSWSPVLGYFSEETFPWFAHPDHGWWYAASGLANDAAVATITGDWFYDAGMEDWVYFEREWYPFLYSYGFEEWLYYFEGSRTPRYFYRLKALEYLTTEE